MKQVTYTEYMNSRSFLNRPVKDSISLKGFTCFKSLDAAKNYAQKNPQLFIVSIQVTQWSETDLYPELIDGIVDGAWGFLIALGIDQGEKTVFNDFPY